MSSTTRSDLPATGSTYQPTKSDAITFSNNNPLGSGSSGSHDHQQHHYQQQQQYQHQATGIDSATPTTATTGTTVHDTVTAPGSTTAMRGTAGTGISDHPTNYADDSMTHPSLHGTTGISGHPTDYHADEANPLRAHHRPSIANATDTGHGTGGALGGDETIRRHGVAQNAPGKLGDRGENILGAVGFGGTHVERPKEDQGIGEKIAEFLGA
ncbi:hypothetical protein A1O7_02331 [Cladophialophora yegresii CBS 114405]|uniref:Uncharacterized protein n=1 Tax=Cladophialophora yegresii CBS 114405 TaxID=1182544 RepID=W9WA89_9EURO|nr:uncharacterized protein A1O7_02331 [Cladophialophora yegresii CBS 114405]EXJ61900.1 hypothetical protein A1O7_02331 [Cladophialophora yegresii CBS 114405]